MLRSPAKFLPKPKKPNLSSVMLGLDPSIHATSEDVTWYVDPRVKPEDDGRVCGTGELIGDAFANFQTASGTRSLAAPALPFPFIALPAT